jgi:P4 family phage/plasmid primase-like protien
MSNDHSIESRVAQSGQFLSQLWGITPKEWVCEFNLLQYRATQEDPDAKRVRALFYRVDQIESDWHTIFQYLEQCNRTQVENIHHSVCPRFRPPKRFGTNADVQAYTALWVDVDFRGDEASIRKQFGETIATLCAQGLRPSCIVESGHGLHAYWFLDRPYPIAEARPCCAGIMDYFKISDPIHDPRRILRVPGFLNLKDPKNPKWCYVAEATWERFPLSAFETYKIEPTKSEHDRELEEIESLAVRTASRNPKIEEIKNGVNEGGGPFGGRHLSAVALAGHYCARRKLTKKAIISTMLSWNEKNTPPLPEREILRIVEDIWTKEQVKRTEEEGEKAKSKQKEENGSGGKGPNDGPPWFDENGKWRPAPLVDYLMQKERYLSTPIGQDGKGITLYRYSNGVYQSDGFDFARRQIMRILGMDARKSRIEETVELLNERAKRSYTDVNRHAHELINVQNGMLRWRTGELLPHDPQYLSLIQIPVPWDPNAKSAELDRFLDTVLPKDALSLAEEFIGLLLVPNTSFSKCMVLVGEGGNGKSTFLHLVEVLLGEQNVSHYSLHSIVEDRFTSAGLIGKLANFYDELEQRALENTGVFKQIVAGDPIKAEEKNKAPFSFRPFCRLVFATNQMPRATDRSQAYFDRFLFIEFKNRIRNTTGEILDYGRVLANTPGVLPALLFRAVAGLRRLMERGRFVPPQSSIDAIEEYRRDCNSAYDFISEFCRTDDPNGWIAKNVLYERYRAWCEDEGRKPLSAREFGRTVQQMPNVRGVRHGTGRGWGGISWVDGQPPVSANDEVARFGQPDEYKGQRRLDLDF